MTLHRFLSHESAGDLSRSFGQGPRVLHRSWVLATAAGETLGFLAPALVAPLVFDLPLAVALLVMVVVGAIEGAVLGAAQSVVLRREFLGFPRAAWIGATALGASATWLLGMLPSTLSDVWTDWPVGLLVPLGVLLGAALLASIGLAQWTVLRHHVPRALTWVPANAVARATGLTVFGVLTTPLWREGQSTAVTVAIGLLGGAAMALAVALVTGAWLVRMVSGTSSRASSAASRATPSGVPQQDWGALAEPTDGFRLFDPGELGHLPEPVQRWLRHTISPGAALLTGVDAEWIGHLRMGRSWRPFISRQRATLDRGFVWAARARISGLPVAGFDRFTRGEGQMCWRALRRFTMISADGEAIARSAAGRHAAEMLAAVPAVALAPSVEWTPIDPDRATAHLTVGGERQSVTVTVDPVGRLRQLEMERWGAPPGCSYGHYRFGALLGEERRFDGYLVPTEVVGGWHFGTGRWNEGVSLRYRMVRCSFH